MPQLMMLAVVLIIILIILLTSVYAGGKRPFFRIVKAGDKYIIQYRKYVYLWRTYTIPNTGEPAVYYSLMEAEEMISVLVERRHTTKTLNAIPTSKIEIFEYTEKGSIMNKKETRVIK